MRPPDLADPAPVALAVDRPRRRHDRGPSPAPPARSRHASRWPPAALRSVARTIGPLRWPGWRVLDTSTVQTPAAEAPHPTGGSWPARADTERPAERPGRTVAAASRGRTGAARGTAGRPRTRDARPAAADTSSQWDTDGPWDGGREHGADPSKWPGRAGGQERRGAAGRRRSAAPRRLAARAGRRRGRAGPGSHVRSFAGRRQPCAVPRQRPSEPARVPRRLPPRAAPLRPVADPAPRPPDAAPRRRHGLGEARGLQLRPRLRRQQGPQARVPRWPTRSRRAATRSSRSAASSRTTPARSRPSRPTPACGASSSRRAGWTGRT